MNNKKKKILVVEDDELTLRTLGGRLAREGFTVLEADNGEDGLKIALAEHPDLILLDLIIPLMDGITVLERLREDEAGKNIRVIILSNLSDAEKVEKAVKGNVHDYLVKTDWSLEELVGRVYERLDMK